MAKYKISLTMNIETHRGKKMAERIFTNIAKMSPYVTFPNLKTIKLK